MNDQIAPHSLDAEVSVLGSVLIDPNAMARISDQLLPSGQDFYRSQHGEIYAAAYNLFKRREPIDLTLMADELRKTGALDRIGGPAYLTHLMNQTPTAVHVQHYAKIVRDKAGLRRLIEATPPVDMRGGMGGV